MRSCMDCACPPLWPRKSLLGAPRTRLCAIGRERVAEDHAPTRCDRIIAAARLAARGLRGARQARRDAGENSGNGRSMRERTLVSGHVRGLAESEEYGVGDVLGAQDLDALKRTNTRQNCLEMEGAPITACGCVQAVDRRGYAYLGAASTSGSLMCEASSLSVAPG